MERIEMKIVMEIKKRLAEAAESSAKLEMIEELSENLYQRYQELVQEGKNEQEALEITMDSLGDEEELLEYLADLNDTAEILMMPEMDRMDSVDYKEEFSIGNMKEKILGQALEIPIIDVTRLEIDVKSMNIIISGTNQNEQMIRIWGGLQAVDISVEKGGKLMISQRSDNKKGIWNLVRNRKNEIRIQIPQDRMNMIWEKIVVSSRSGDIEMCGPISCYRVNGLTHSGDIRLSDIAAQEFEISRTSGKFTGKNINGGFLQSNSTSGNTKIQGIFAGCTVYSTGGDFIFQGKSQKIECGSTSGDMEILCDILPQMISAGTSSGNMEIGIPKQSDFRLSFGVSSGTFECKVPYVLEQCDDTEEAEEEWLIFGQGGSSIMELGTSSGDIRLFEMNEIK